MGLLRISETKVLEMRRIEIQDEVRVRGHKRDGESAVAACRRKPPAPYQVTRSARNPS